ncbi:MAG: hypothetical protein ACFFAS_04110 [Promethearchaeota archaeon]
MKIKLPLMIQDPSLKDTEMDKWYEGFHPDKEEFYLDGPVSKRLAVIDFDPKDGRVKCDAIFRPPDLKKKMGWYQDINGLKLHKIGKKQIFNSAFLQVCSFAMALRVMYMFERKETLGRNLIWAFNAPQLLIVPRAGEMANAFYHRDAHCVQFYFVTLNKKTIFTCLSRDIVAHEMGHAIIDGINPDLLDACTPQSLAIHEAIADLTACLMAFESHTLRSYVLEKTKGNINDSSVFSSIGEELGALLKHKYGLRNLNNEKNIISGEVSRIEPHELSQVLSGALYRILIEIYNGLMNKYVRKEQKFLLKDINPEWAPDLKEEIIVSKSGYSLAKATERFQRMIFRALDYLPPGEVSFADYGRAIIAVDSIAYQENKEIRNWIVREFLERGIINDKKSLKVDLRLKSNALKKIDIKMLYDSDWLAYWFANNNKDLLFIPEGVVFEVYPRLLLKKKYEKKQVRTELIFKVSWWEVETVEIGSKFPNHLLIRVGTTLAIEWVDKTILARLTNIPPNRKELSENRKTEYQNQLEDRKNFLKKLVEKGILKHGAESLSLNSVQAKTIEGKMQVKGSGKLLHIIAMRGGKE